MTDFKLSDLMARFDGWEVVSAVTHGDMTEIRIASTIESAPDWVLARGAVFIAAVPGEIRDRAVIGEKMIVAEDRVSAGAWEVEASLLVAGQMLESAIVLVPDPKVDPVDEPATAADFVIESGSLVWPTMADLPEELRGLELLEGLTRMAFTQPSLIVSIAVESGALAGRVWEIFVTPFGAVESEQHRDSNDPMSVSYFPLSDLPSRMLERTGVARLVGPGSVSSQAQTVVVRSTYMDDQGLVAGALAWEESEDGGLVTEDGEIGSLSVASELLRMLPGGDIDLASSSKGVVVDG